MRHINNRNIPADYKRARELRKNASPVEQKLWRLLKTAAACHELNFRRQHAVHPYFADFACLRARLLIELDGFSHDVRADYDKARDEFLRCQNYRVMRFANKDVCENGEAVVLAIILEAKRLIADDATGEAEERMPPSGKN